jgi:hypothetical protein
MCKTDNLRTWPDVEVGADRRIHVEVERTKCDWGYFFRELLLVAVSKQVAYTETSEWTVCLSGGVVWSAMSQDFNI